MLVILAILAAILVPALLGWIDEAKKKQTVLEARNVYIATQTIADEQYAKGEKNVLDLSEDDVTRIGEIADVDGLQFHSLSVISNTAITTGDHDAFTVVGMAIEFTPSKGGAKTYAQLEGDTWEVYDDTDSFTAAKNEEKVTYINPTEGS